MTSIVGVGRIGILDLDSGIALHIEPDRLIRADGITHEFGISKHD